MKFKVAFYGAAVNVLIVVAIVLFSAAKRGFAGFSAYLSALPILAVAAFVVYYFIVSAYVAKRPGILKPLFFDCLIGMLSEITIIVLGVVLYSLFLTISYGKGVGIAAFSRDLASGILINLLWVFAMFMVQILIVGNLAGLIGWYLLKKHALSKPS